MTAVDTTNGTSQYSTNGGSAWSTFSGLSTFNAMLLKADASTYVRFVPNANWNGTLATGITFRAWDQTSGTAGNTANTTSNGGTTAFSVGTASASITVDPVNDARAGANRTVTTLEDTGYTFGTSDFGFTDASDSPANTLLAVKITTLPGAGSLTDNAVAVTAGSFVSVTDINSGKLIFTPAANANGAGYASFTFQVQDDGGTLNGGVDLDQSPNTITVNVTAVNDAPAGSNNSVTTLEGSAYTFAAVDFGFSDAVDSPANNLSAVTITTIPAAGSLTDNGVALSAGQSVTLANIAAGNLKFTPSANANGAGYASFTFQVQDDGGTANGGVDLDLGAKTLTIDVSAVDDAPSIAQNTLTISSGSSVTLSSAQLSATDIDNAAAGLLFDVSAVTHGQFELASAPAVPIVSFTQAQISGRPEQRSSVHQIRWQRAG